MIRYIIKLSFVGGYFIFCQTYNQDLKNKTNDLWLYDDLKKDYIALNELTINKTYIFTFFNTKTNQSINALNKINQISFAIRNRSLAFCNINVLGNSENVKIYKSKYANSMRVLYDKKGLLYKRFKFEALPVTIIFDDDEIKYITNNYSENSIHKLINNIYKTF